MSNKSKKVKQKKKHLRTKNGSLNLVIIVLLIACTIIWISIISNKNNQSINTSVESLKIEQELSNEETLDIWKMQEKEENGVEQNNIEKNLIEQNTIEENNAENTVKSTNKADKEIKYYIKVNNQANVVNIYTKDKNGEFTVPYKAMICSIGKATPAAGNIYSMANDKWNRSTWGAMVGGVYAQYYSRITGNILFHSVPYTKQKKSCLEYWEYDKLGTKASAGCIRLTVEDAKWIYNNCPPGTKVEFYESSDPGPFGKPTAQKISNESSSVRGWDPTDPDSSNPWRKYEPNEKSNINQKESQKENTISNVIIKTPEETKNVSNTESNIIKNNEASANQDTNISDNQTRTDNVVENEEKTSSSSIENNQILDDKVKKENEDFTNDIAGNNNTGESNTIIKDNTTESNETTKNVIYEGENLVKENKENLIETE